MRLFIAAFLLAVLWWFSEAMVRHWPITLGALTVLGAMLWWDYRRAPR